MKFRTVLLSTLFFSIYVFTRIFTQEPPKPTEYSDQLQLPANAEFDHSSGMRAVRPAATQPQKAPPTGGNLTQTLNERELVRLTLDASLRAFSLAKAQNLDLSTTAALRVAVHSDCVSKSRYSLDIVEESRKPNDYETSSYGVRILVDPQSLLYLRGTLIDYKTTAGHSGFYFNNPNAEASP